MTTLRGATQLEIIWEELCFDGGWLTLEGVNLLIPSAKPSSVKKRLLDLVKEGRVERRHVLLPITDHNGRPNSHIRVEYRGVQE